MVSPVLVLVLVLVSVLLYFFVEATHYGVE